MQRPFESVSDSSQGTNASSTWFLSGISKILTVQSTWWVALACFVWLAATTGLYPLLLPDEGRYVGVSWEMLSAGQFSVPRLDGLPFFHKPPLFYWLTALSMHFFGVNEWAARLSSVLAATLTVTLLFWFLKKYANQRLAITAALVLASQPFFFGGSHYANLDMTVASLISATVIVSATAVFKYERGESYRVVLAWAYALAALGFLAKGLIGVVLPGGVIFFWLLGRRRFDTMLKLLWLPGIAIFLALSLPWVLYMQQRYSGFFDYYFVYQHFERFLQKGFNNPQPFWFYVPVLLALTLPWSIQLWRVLNRKWWVDSQHAAIRGLMVSWLLLIVIFFSLPTSKLVGYVLPALAPFSFLVADVLVRRFDGPSARRTLLVFGWSLGISVAICLSAVVTMVVRPQPGTKALATAMRAHYQPQDQVIMLERYRYDLDFYLASGKPSFVVSDWDDPKIKHMDNWRAELLEAGEFEPEAAARLLIRPRQLVDKLCSPRPGNLWLIGEAGSPEHYGFLADLEEPMQDGKLRAWKVSAGPPLGFCATGK